MLIQKGGCTYMLTNDTHSVIYIGVTSDLPKRIKEHKMKLYPDSFTSKFNCDILIWYEVFSQISEAIIREKQLKAGNRKRKLLLVEQMNPEWKDLYDQLSGW